jgi:hypothetical protein
MFKLFYFLLIKLITAGLILRIAADLREKIVCVK